MAEVATLSVMLKARDGLSGPLGKAQKKMENVSDTAKKMGKAMTLVGAAITAAFALSIKSSQEQQVGINRLDAALQKIGTSYDAEREAIERVIEAQQRKTNFGDEAQRTSLTLLTAQLGSTEKALQVLPLALDAAAFSGKDLSSVMQTLPRFFSGVTNTSVSAGVAVSKLATFEERLAAITKTVGGQAAAAADPFVQLKNRMGDMSQVLGDALLPFVTRAAVVVESMTRKIIDWSSAHPRLTKVLAIAAASVGALLLVLGPLLIMLPAIAAGVGLVSAASLPLTIIPLAIAAAVAALVVMFVKWESMSTKVKVAILLIAPPLFAAVVAAKFLQKNWDTIWSGILKIVETSVNQFIKAINLLLEGLATINPLMEKRVIPTIDLTTRTVERMGAMFSGAADDVMDATGRIVAATEDMVTTLLTDEDELSQQIKKELEERAKAHREFALQAVANAAETAGRITKIDTTAADEKLAKLEENSKRELALILSNDADLLAMQRERLQQEKDAAIAKNDAIMASDAKAVAAALAGHDKLNASVDATIRRFQDQASEAGRMGLTIDKVGLAFLVTTGNIDLLRRALTAVAQNNGGINDFLNALGLEAKFADNMVDDLNNSLNNLETSAKQGVTALAEKRFMQIVAQRLGVARQIHATAQERFAAGATSEGERLTKIADEMRELIRIAQQNFAKGIATPGFAHGGIVPGPVGQPQLAVVHGGEGVFTPRQMGGAMTKVLNLTVNYNAPSFESRDTVAQIWREVAEDGGFQEFIAG